MELTRLVHLPRAPGSQEASLRDPPTRLCSEGVFTDECTPTVSGPHTATPGWNPALQLLLRPLDHGVCWSAG